MMAIDYIQKDQKTSIELLNEKNHPTPALIGLAAAEITFDVALGYAAYRIFRLVSKKKA